MRPPLLLNGLAAMLLCFTGCQALVSETLDISNEGRPYGACRYQAGAYALPKDLIKLEIRRKIDTSTGQEWFEASSITTKRTADPNRIYCLDFLGSALSRDRVSIGRDDDGSGQSSLLLTKISSAFDDQTLVIGDAIVDAAARIAARPRGGFLGESDEEGKIEVVVGEFEFDPFDRGAMMKINAALDSLDHCVFLDPTNDPHVANWHASLCGRGATVPSKDPAPYHGLSIVRAEPPPSSDALRGVLYRPLLTHKLVVLRRNHGATGAAWRIFATKRIQMTNAAPAFLLEINRSLFVERKMDIVFSQGVLASVNVEKPSEIDALSGFALRTMQVVVSIPMRALILGKSEASNRRAVIQAQAQLIETLEAYQDAIDAAAQQRAGLKDVRPTRFGTAGFVATDTVDAESNLLAACIRAAEASYADPQVECVELLQSGGTFEQ